MFLPVPSLPWKISAVCIFAPGRCSGSAIHLRIHSKTLLSSPHRYLSSSRRRLQEPSLDGSIPMPRYRLILGGRTFSAGSKTTSSRFTVRRRLLESHQSTYPYPKCSRDADDIAQLMIEGGLGRIDPGESVDQLPEFLPEGRITWRGAPRARRSLVIPFFFLLARRRLLRDRLGELRPLLFSRLERGDRLRDLFLRNRQALDRMQVVEVRPSRALGLRVHLARREDRETHRGDADLLGRSVRLGAPGVLHHEGTRSDIALRHHQSKKPGEHLDAVGIGIALRIDAQLAILCRIDLGREPGLVVLARAPLIAHALADIGREVSVIVGAEEKRRLRVELAENRGDRAQAAGVESHVHRARPADGLAYR